MCSNCLVTKDLADHVFTSCYVAIVVWQRIEKWFSIQHFQVKGNQGLTEVVKQIPYMGVKEKCSIPLLWWSFGAYGRL